MLVALITSNQRLSQTLKEAFGAVDVDLQLYVSLDEFKNKPEVDVCLIDILTQNFDKSQKSSDKTVYFAINGDLDSKSSNFSKIYAKPFRIGGLIHDIQTHITKNMQLSALKPIKMGKFTLNPHESTLIDQKRSENYKLTEKEQDILLYLYTHKSEGVTKQGLLDGVWGYADGVETHTLETHIYRLRQKIEVDPANPKFLVTDGEGYCLNF